MLTFPGLLRRNRNYRRMWISQVVSEVGDNFNTIAVFSLVLENTRSGAAVSGVMLARAVAMITAGPLAGVILDRLNRQHVLIASTAARAVVAACFVFTVDRADLWLIYALSGMLMFVSPFFNSGRTAILPTIASPEELHTANALTQTTRYATVTVGTMLGGLSTAALGYEAAFLLNAASLLFSAWMISRLRLTQGSFRAQRKALTEADVARPWHDYREGLRYLKSEPLMLAICLVHVGWATGGGAAQILFSLFGEVVFERGPAGIGMMWSSAGVGLVVGGSVAHRIGPKLHFENYKKLLIAAFAVHGGSYILFSQAPHFWAALLFIAVSRAAWGGRHGPQLKPNAGARRRQLPRPCFLDDRIDDLGYDDAVAGRGRFCFRRLRPARHWRLCRYAQFLDRNRLGLGALAWQARRARGRGH